MVQTNSRTPSPVLALLNAPTLAPLMKTKLFLILALALAVKAQAFECIVSRTGSMEPALHGGEHVEVCTAWQFKDLKPGLIVCYRNPLLRLDGLIVHRVDHWQTATWYRQAGWIMKGDANDRFDPGLLTVKNYIGVVLKYK